MNDSFQSDFRFQATQLSEQLLEISHTNDPLDADISLCLRTENPASSMKLTAWIAICCAIVGIITLVAGGIIGGLIERMPDSLPQNLWLTIAVVCTISGTLILLIPSTMTGFFLRSRIGRRYEVLTTHEDFTDVMYLEIEDGNTFSQFKLAPDDAGYLALDPAGQRLIIEGVLCRYVIQAKDVQDVEIMAAPGANGILVSFAVGGEIPLKLAFAKFHAWSEVLRQTLGKVQNPLEQKINQTLGRDI